MASLSSWQSEFNRMRSGLTLITAMSLLGTLFFAGCQTKPAPPTATPAPPPVVVERTDDLIIVAGQPFHTGTRVVTWREPGGFNAYDFVPTPQAGKENHGQRRLATDESVPAPKVWDLATLQGIVDQFVLHYDSEGFSYRTFPILQKRGLSAHFLLDVDGTLYQTLDLRERAYHATVANSRAIGIEIANPGAYAPAATKELEAWYETETAGGIRQLITEKDRVLTAGFVARPDRASVVVGKVNGEVLHQYDFTPEQYGALIKLTATLHRIFPRMALDYPRDPDGRLLMKKLSDENWEKFRGVLGHFHIQANKVDPGPAFQWDRIIEGAREIDAQNMSTNR
jgi:N-acetylmuramoyl-L-alanine amidase